MHSALCLLLALAQQPAPTFRSDVALVRVDVSVANGDRLVTGLTREDFVIYDEGQPQQVLYFDAESGPADILLLLDVSGSMRRSMEELKSVARAALARLGPDDRVAVMTFTLKPKLILPLTADRAAAAEALGRTHVPFFGGTNIYEGIRGAARHFLSLPRPARGERETRRRAVLVITDNIAFGSKKEKDTLNDAWEADAVVYGLVVRARRPMGLPRRRLALGRLAPRRQDVARIAEQTGGEVREAATVTESLSPMLERIRTRYSLHYAAPQTLPGQARKIRVDLAPEARNAHPSARVTHRTGYHSVARE